MPNKSPLSPGSSNRAAFVTARIAGLLVGGLGLCLAYGSITEFIRHIRGSQSFAGVIASIFFDVLLGLVAFWCMRSCYQSWRSKENIPFRSLSAILAISFFDILFIRLFNNSAAHLPGLTVEVWESLLMLVGVYALTSAAATVIACRGPGDWRYLPIMPAVFASFHVGFGYGFLRGMVDFFVLRRRGRLSFGVLTRGRM